MKVQLHSLALAAAFGALLPTSVLAQDAIVPTDFATISAAVQGAADVDGDGTVHIFVQAGTYAESVLVQRSNVRLEGAGATTTTIQGNPLMRAVNVQAVMNFELSGFSITGEPTRDGVEVTGCDNVSIHDNVVFGTQDGIRVNRTSNTDVFANEVHHNTSSGIKLKGGGANSITGNDCHDNFSSGVDLDRTTDCLVAGNTCTMNASNGVRLRRSTDIVAQNNTCQGNFDSGLFLRELSGVEILSNVCTGNSQNGVRLRDVSSSLFDANVFTGNGEYGIRTRDSFGNDWDGTQPGSQGERGNNDVSGNTLGAIRID